MSDDNVKLEIDSGSAAVIAHNDGTIELTVNPHDDPEHPVAESVLIVSSFYTLLYNEDERLLELLREQFRKNTEEVKLC